MDHVDSTDGRGVTSRLGLYIPAALFAACVAYPSFANGDPLYLSCKDINDETHLIALDKDELSATEYDADHRVSYRVILTVKDNEYSWRPPDAVANGGADEDAINRFSLKFSMHFRHRDHWDEEGPCALLDAPPSPRI